MPWTMRTRFLETPSGAVTSLPISWLLTSIGPLTHPNSSKAIFSIRLTSKSICSIVRAYDPSHHRPDLLPCTTPSTPSTSASTDPLDNTRRHRSKKSPPFPNMRLPPICVRSTMTGCSHQLGMEGGMSGIAPTPLTDPWANPTTARE